METKFTNPKDVSENRTKYEVIISLNKEDLANLMKRDDWEIWFNIVNYNISKVVIKKEKE